MIQLERQHAMTRRMLRPADYGDVCWDYVEDVAVLFAATLRYPYCGDFLQQLIAEYAQLLLLLSELVHFAC